MAPRYLTRQPKLSDGFEPLARIWSAPLGVDNSAPQSLALVRAIGI